MADVDLDLGDVVAEYDVAAPPEGQSSVNGTQPAWSDDPDVGSAVIKAILDESDIGYFGNASAPVIGDATKAASINGLIRWLPDEDLAAPGPVRATLRVDGIDAAVTTFTQSGSGIQYGAVIFFSGDVVPGSGFGWDDITAAVVDDRVELVMGIDQMPETSGPNPTASIIDVALTAHYLENLYASPARLHPREDGLGVGGARIFPRPASHQNSGRFAGGYY